MELKKIISQSFLAAAMLAQPGCGGDSPAGPSGLQSPSTPSAIPLPSSASQVPCSQADPNDNFPDDDALISCISAAQEAQEVVLYPGSPGYILQKGLHFEGKNVHLRGLGSGQKATLIADPMLDGPLLSAHGFISFSLENLVFDGNKYLRTYQKCNGFPRATNILLRGYGFRVENIESVRTVCGSGIDVAGQNFIVANNTVDDSGYSNNPAIGSNPWSDGITVGECIDGVVRSNTIKDSSDVGLLSGGGVGCVFEGNVVMQASQKAFAGLAVHNFTPGGMGDHTGASYRNNRVESTAGMLDYGISVGIHSWFPNPTTSYGEITQNRIRGASVGISIDGFSSGTVSDNLIESIFQEPVKIGACYGKIISAETAIAHVDSACIQPSANSTKYAITDQGSKCSLSSVGACSVFRQTPQDCEHFEDWSLMCEQEKDQKKK